MWLQEFHRLFPHATELCAPKRQNLSAVEDRLADARSTMRIGPREFKLIETSDAWSYATWWPRLSGQLDTELQLPKDLASPAAREKAVSILDDRLKHIEAVSVVLRFLRPDHFGIISPPTICLINLAPAATPVEYYMRYLGVLSAIAAHYSVLPRNADIDMALWSAAQLSAANEYPRLTEEMYDDEYFQQLRLTNLLGGLPTMGHRTDRQRLLFARVLLEHDYLTAALIAASEYEATIREIAQRHRIHPSPKDKQTDVGSLVEKLERQQDVLRELDVPRGDLTKWWKWRSRAVHSNPPITQREANQLVREVARLCDALTKWRAE